MSLRTREQTEGEVWDALGTVGVGSSVGHREHERLIVLEDEAADKCTASVLLAPDSQGGGEGLGERTSHPQTSLRRSTLLQYRFLQ